MTSICILGKGSFVGTAVARYLKDCYPDEFSLKEVDTRSDAWKQEDFSAYDALFYVAGIVPWALDKKQQGLRSAEETQAYLDAVNAELAFEIATKAKRDGVPYLIFMSTSDVYAKSRSADPSYTITHDTDPAPESPYGVSKLKAEQLLEGLEDEGFVLAVLRPPLIYGPGCRKGSFAALVKLSAKTPFFPRVNNARSMLFTGNLAELVAALCRQRLSGVFLPQDPSWVATATLVELLSRAQGRSVRLIGWMAPTCTWLARYNSTFRKLFGNFKYAQDSRLNDIRYQRYAADEAIALMFGGVYPTRQ